MPFGDRVRKFANGSRVSCLTKYLHPRAAIKTAIPDAILQQRLSDMVVVGTGLRRVGRRFTLCVTCTSPSVKNEDGSLVPIHGAQQWFTIIPNDDNDEESSTSDTSALVMTDEDPGEIELPTRLDDEAITELVGTGLLEIDDDNQPAPENNPGIFQPGTEAQYTQWRVPRICPFKATSTHCRPSITGQFVNPNEPTLLEVWDTLFFRDFAISTIIPATNARLQGPALTYEELKRYPGVWLLVSLHDTGEDRRIFWSTKMEKYGPSARFNHIISGRRFENITRALWFTLKQPPMENDRFWAIRDMSKTWNDNMAEVFRPGPIVVVDESVSKWLSKFTCPGFMVFQGNHGSSETSGIRLHVAMAVSCFLRKL